MILMIDNYDSFTYNVYQYIGSLYPQIQVVRNDEITIEEIKNLQNLEALVISPGPRYPDSAGISKDVIKTFGKDIPILGICLGHQAIGEVYGGKVVPAKELMHGKMSEITIDNKNPLFEGLEDKIYAARYHSLIINDETIPDKLEIIGRDEKGQIMAVCHKEYPVYGIQFHPESIYTDHGKKRIHLNRNGNEDLRKFFNKHRRNQTWRFYKGGNYERSQSRNIKTIFSKDRRRKSFDRRRSL